MSCLSYRGEPLHVVFQWALYSPASRAYSDHGCVEMGGGAVLPPRRLSGRWSKEDSRLLINSLELRAVILALQCFEELVQGHAVLVRTDNETVVASFNHQGGSHSQSLCRLALYLWEWCLPRGIHLSASHISVEEFLLADFLSRGIFLPSEWMLNVQVFGEFACISLLLQKWTCLPLF